MARAVVNCKSLYHLSTTLVSVVSAALVSALLKKDKVKLDTLEAKTC